MATYMNYCRNLGFDETPNYAYLRRLFNELYNKCQFEHEFVFDWTIQRFRVEPQNLPQDEEHKQQNSSAQPESLRNHGGGANSEDNQKNQEQWAKEKEDQLSEIERKRLQYMQEPVLMNENSRLDLAQAQRASITSHDQDVKNKK